MKSERLNTFIFLTFLFCISSPIKCQESEINLINSKVEKIKSDTLNCVKAIKRFDKDYKITYTCNNKNAIVILTAFDAEIQKNVLWIYENELLIYADQFWFNSLTGTVINSEKFYLKNNSLIAWIDSDNSFVDTSSEKFANTGKDIINFATKQIKKD